MRWEWRVFGLLLTVTALGAPVVADSPPSGNAPSNTIPLTFGRCQLWNMTCPPDTEPGAAGSPEFRTLMLRCFSEALGRTVAEPDGTADAMGWWIDVSIPPEIQTPDAGQSLTTVLLKAGEIVKTGLYVIDVPTAKNYEFICRDFAEKIRGGSSDGGGGGPARALSIVSPEFPRYFTDALGRSFARCRAAQGSRNRDRQLSIMSPELLNAGVANLR